MFSVVSESHSTNRIFRTLSGNSISLIKGPKEVSSFFEVAF